MMYINSGLMNLIEDQFWPFFSGGQPDSLKEDFSFGNSFWFSLVTMTTIGYGDVVPRTQVGKAVDSCYIILSVILVPLEITALTEVGGEREKKREREIMTMEIAMFFPAGCVPACLPICLPC